MQKKVEVWEELSRELAFKKYSRAVEKIIFCLPDGHESDFYIKREGAVVCILGLTKNMEVVLVRQFRPGPNKVLSELPGGGIDEGEEPLQAAEREFLEETGYKGNMQLVTGAWDCGWSTRYRYCFVATDCEKVKDIKDDPNEPLELELMSLENFRKHIKTGELTDVDVAYLGLDFLGLL